MLQMKALTARWVSKVLGLQLFVKALLYVDAMGWRIWVRWFRILGRDELFIGFLKIIELQNVSYTVR